MKLQIRCVFLVLAAMAPVLNLAAQTRAQSKADLMVGKFYTPNTIQDIHLTIADDDFQRMQEALPERVYVPGTFRWGDIVLKNVGIRYKGNSSSQPNGRMKKSYLIKFGEYVKRQRFLGLTRVALDNGFQFGGLYSEIIILEILRDLGIPVSRANYARVYLNDEFRGIHVNVERIDETFVKNYFDDPSGMLYKCHTGGPGADFAFVSDNPADYARAFEAKTHKKTAGYHDVVEFIRDINQTPNEEIAAKLGEILELEDFLWQTAVFALAGAFDQYTGWQAHNYYLYHEPMTDRWSYIPWDLDVGFAAEAFGHVPVLEGWNVNYPIPVKPRVLLERIVGNEDLLARYREKAAHVLDAYFQPERIEQRLDELYALIRDDLANDPFRPGRITVPTDRTHEDPVEDMKEFARLRYAKARKEIDENIVTEPIDIREFQRRQQQQHGARRPEGRQPQPGQEQGPKPGEPSDNDPHSLRVADVSADGVKLEWTANTPGAHVHILQKGEGADGKAFFNVIPIELPGTTVTDTQMQSGATFRYRVYAATPLPDGSIKGSGPSNVVVVTIP